MRTIFEGRTEPQTVRVWAGECPNCNEVVIAKDTPQERKRVTVGVCTNCGTMPIRAFIFSMVLDKPIA